ncbi:MAG TPA: hypothetical protein VFT12_05755 [Thermoanaerobaculia bacterium]|nr:hypothetical protein [Thermoanaerobaculia bacterium]
MKERLRRLGAIVRADLLIRFRRPSTVVVFLLLSAFAYIWVPDPATGRALLQIDGKRALYNSAAIGMATAALATMFVGLFGFYVISNAIKRDVLSRCGFVISSTTMRGGEYLIGKVAGNVVFLTTFAAGFMFTAMAMLIVRGEARLEPLVFAKQYLVLLPPMIAFVSVVAIVFESIPFLSGKFGDVAYFFLWVASLGVAASNVTAADPGMWGYLDFSGFGFLKAGLGTENVAIGMSDFDRSKELFVFQGLTVPSVWIAPRVGATLLPFALLPVAMLFFHRFDPARVRKSLQRGSRNWLARVGLLAKPLSRAVYALASRGGSGSILSAARYDALMAMTAVPAVLLVALVVAVLSLSGPVRESLPMAFAAAAVVIADIAARERRAGTTALVYSSPRLRDGFVWWKFAAAVMLSMVVLLVPAVRLVFSEPRSAAALIVGVLFLAATSTALGVLSSNGKTFIVAFLTFWYVVVNDHGTSAALDFAGFYGKATPAVTAAYAGVAIAALAIAQTFHAARLR